MMLNNTQSAWPYDGHIQLHIQCDHLTSNHRGSLNNVNNCPLMVLVVGTRAITHVPSMKKLGTKLKLLVMKIKNKFK